MAKACEKKSVERRWGHKRKKIEAEKKKLKNKLSEKAKNREEAKRVVSWELREASAMLLSAWKNTVSDFFLFCFFPFQRALESSSVVSSRWESMLRRTGAENGLGCVKQLPLTLANAPKWRTQRSKGPVAQSSSQASLRSLQPGRGGQAPIMKANHKSCLKRIHTRRKKSNVDTYFKRQYLDT